MNIKSLGSSSAGNCYIISDGINDIMLDAGLPMQYVRSMYRKPLTKLEGALVTHEHNDHCKSVSKLLGSAVYCFMTEGTKKGIKPPIKGHHRLITIKTGLDKQYETSNYRFMAFDVNHDVNEPCGFVLYSKVLKEKLLYITDTGSLDISFKDIQYIMIEANYDNDLLNNAVIEGQIPAVAARRIRRNHLDIDQCIAFLLNCDLSSTKAIILCHLSNGNSNERVFIDLVQKATGISTYVAESGFKL